MLLMKDDDHNDDGDDYLEMPLMFLKGANVSQEKRRRKKKSARSLKNTQSFLD